MTGTDIIAFESLQRGLFVLYEQHINSIAQIQDYPMSN